MLGYNCLLQNTQLYKDLSDFVKKIMYQRVADGKGVSIDEVYREARNGNFFDVDMNTVGEMYKDIAPQLTAKSGKGILDTDMQVDKSTGRIVNNAVKVMLSNRIKNKFVEVGQQKPSESVATEIVRLFRGEILVASDTQTKTQLKEMQDALRKSAMALLNRENKKTNAVTTEGLLKEALRLDELSVKDLNGRLNTMDDLFNQFAEEIDKVISKMEYGKRGMPQSKKDDIDNRIEKFRNYAENFKKGAYTLALSNNEQEKIIRDLLKEKYPKTITSNGKQRVVLDYNKMLMSKDLKGDVSDVLSSKGFTPSQIDKITDALQVKIDAIKSTSQWNNALASNAKKMLNDDAFLARAAATVVMSKKDINGNYYQKYNVKTQRNEPDWDRWEQDKGQTAKEFQDEVKSIIQNTPKIAADDFVKNEKDKNGNYYKIKDNQGYDVADWKRYATDKNTDEAAIKAKVELKVADSASQYRQVVSELERKNNPTKHLAKSDLEKLLELSQRRGFDELFNAKAYSMLGLSEQESEAGRQVQELSNRVKEVLDKGGKQSKIAMGKILDDINAIMDHTQGEKSPLLSFARSFENLMGVRNAYRLLNYLNVMENNLSGFNQIIQSYEQAFSSEAARKELGKMFTVMGDVAAGGKHFDMTDIEKLSFNSHEYRFDTNKSIEHNLRSLMTKMPNLLLGVMDSAAHSYTMRIMFYNSAVLTRESKLMKNEIDDLVRKGIEKNEAKRIVERNQKEIKKRGKEKNIREKAIDDVTDALYNPTAEQEAYNQAKDILSLVSSEVRPAEIKREADNLMFQNLVAKGILDASQLDPLLKAADTSSKKAIGKVAAFNWLGETMTIANRKSRENIKKSIQDGKLNKAAKQIILNAVVMKGIFPFISGAANWGVIAAKKTPLGLLSLIPFHSHNLRDNIAMAADLNPKELEESMERYNSLRNDVYFSFQGMIWGTMIMGALYAIKSSGDDDDEDLLEWVNEQFKEMSEDNRLRKMLTRWMPPIMQTYNLVNENTKGNHKSSMIDNAGQLFGYGALENPITKAIKYTGPKHAAAGIGQAAGSIFDVGAAYNSINSYFDLAGEPQDDQVKSHSTYIGDQLGLEENDFINGIISGMMGYNLHQDINNWFDFTPSK